MANTLISKIKKMIIDKHITDTITPTDTLNAVLRDSNGKIKAVRDVSDEHELAANYNKENLEEKYTVKQKTQKIINKQQHEIQVANRFLSVFNVGRNDTFIIAQIQP